MGKNYELGSVVGLLFPKLGFPEAATVIFWRSSPSVQEMLTHKEGMWVNFCPADLCPSQTLIFIPNFDFSPRMQVGIVARAELEVFDCLVE